MLNDFFFLSGEKSANLYGGRVQEIFNMVIQGWKQHLKLYMKCKYVWIFKRNISFKKNYALNEYSLLQTIPDKHGRVVLVPCKIDASVRYCTVTYTEQITFSMYQNNTAMYIWWPCTWGVGVFSDRG